jgi:hypothetical protein
LMTAAEHFDDGGLLHALHRSRWACAASWRSPPACSLLAHKTLCCRHGLAAGPCLTSRSKAWIASPRQGRPELSQDHERQQQAALSDSTQSHHSQQVLGARLTSPSLCLGRAKLTSRGNTNTTTMSSRPEGSQCAKRLTCGGGGASKLEAVQVAMGSCPLGRQTG